MKPTQKNNLEEITNLAVNVGNCLIKFRNDKKKESKQSAENALSDYNCALEDICKNENSDKKQEFLDFFSCKKLIVPIVDTFQKNMKNLKNINEEGIKYLLSQLFVQEVEKNEVFLTTYFLKDQLIKQVQGAVTYYKNYSTYYCRLSLVNRHRGTGRKRATDFLAHIQSLESSEDITAAIVKHLKEGGGNTHPHSFKTVLLASFDPIFKQKFDELPQHLFESVTSKPQFNNLPKKEDPLLELLTNISNKFKNFLEKKFPQTKTWAKTNPGKPASSIYEIKKP